MKPAGIALSAFTLNHQYFFPSGLRLEIVHGDLTEEKTGAIVNAANSHLRHGGGVAAAIVRRGGAIIQEESDAWVQQHGLVAHTLPAYTGPGTLACRYFIHAVGPVWGEGEEKNKLASAISGSLDLANKLGLDSIAFPPIATGIFGFPKELAAEIFFNGFNDYFLTVPDTHLRLIRLTILDRITLDIFLAVFERWKTIHPEQKE
jgi:O-acetyl-ADP-ribose deacetylase (regulator of RNase III)